MMKKSYLIFQILCSCLIALDAVSAQNAEQDYPGVWVQISQQGFHNISDLAGPWMAGLISKKVQPLIPNNYTVSGLHLYNLGMKDLQAGKDMAFIDLNEETKSLDATIIDIEGFDLSTNFHLNFLKGVIDRYGYVKAQIDHIKLGASLAFKKLDVTGIPKIEIDNLWFTLDNPQVLMNNQLIGDYAKDAVTWVLDFVMGIVSHVVPPIANFALEYIIIPKVAYNGVFPFSMGQDWAFMNIDYRFVNEPIVTEEKFRLEINGNMWEDFYGNPYDPPTFEMFEDNQESYDIQISASNQLADMIVNSMVDMSKVNLPFYYKMPLNWASFTINTSDMKLFAPTAHEVYGYRNVSLLWKPLNMSTIDFREEDQQIIIDCDTLMSWTINEKDNNDRRMTAWQNMASLQLVFNATIKPGKILDFYIDKIHINDYVITQDNCGCKKDDLIAADALNSMFEYIVSLADTIFPNLKALTMMKLTDALGIKHMPPLLKNDMMFHLFYFENYAIANLNISKDVIPRSEVFDLDLGELDINEPYYIDLSDHHEAIDLFMKAKGY